MAGDEIARAAWTNSWVNDRRVVGSAGQSLNGGEVGEAEDQSPSFYPEICGLISSLANSDITFV